MFVSSQNKYIELNLKEVNDKVLLESNQETQPSTYGILFIAWILYHENKYVINRYMLDVVFMEYVMMSGC